jgi:hypothetical protein
MPKKKKTDGGIKAAAKQVKLKDKKAQEKADKDAGIVNVKIGKGAKNKGGGSVRTAKEAVEKGGVMVKEWQKIPTQMLQEYCQVRAYR